MLRALVCSGAGARRTLPSIQVQAPRAPEQPRPTSHPGPVAARHRSAGQRPRIPDSRFPANAGRRWVAVPSLCRDCGPELQEGGLCLSRRGLRAAAHDAARRTGVCHRSLGARPRPRRSPALPSAFSHCDPERSERSHAACVALRRARRDADGRRPHRFSPTFCLSPLSSSPIRGKKPGDGRRRPGTSDCSAPSCLTRRFLTARSFLSLFSRSPFTPRAESGAEARRDWWASRADSARVLPSERLPGQGVGAGQRPRAGLRRQDCAPHPAPPPDASAPRDAQPRSGPGPGRSAGAAAKARESPAFLTGSESSPPASRRPEAPRLWGSARPRQAGSTRASSSGSGGRSGHLLGWPPRCGRPRPGGHTEALCPSLCALEEKGFPLQSTKANRAGRALKRPGLGRGRPEAWERSGGAGLRAETVARPRAGERGAGGRRTAATGVLAEKFCSQVGGRAIVTQFRAGLRKIQLQKEQRAAVRTAVLPPRSVVPPGGRSPGPGNPGGPPRVGLLSGQTGPARRSGEFTDGIRRVHLGASTCLLPACCGYPHRTPPPPTPFTPAPARKVSRAPGGPRRPGCPRGSRRAGAALCRGGRGPFSLGSPLPQPASRLGPPAEYHPAPAPPEITAGYTREPGERAFSRPTQTKWGWGLLKDGEKKPCSLPLLSPHPPYLSNSRVWSLPLPPPK